MIQIRLRLGKLLCKSLESEFVRLFIFCDSSSVDSKSETHVVSFTSINSAIISKKPSQMINK